MNVQIISVDKAEQGLTTLYINYVQTGMYFY